MYFQKNAAFMKTTTNLASFWPEFFRAMMNANEIHALHGYLLVPKFYLGIHALTAPLLNEL